MNQRALFLAFVVLMTFFCYFNDFLSKIINLKVIYNNISNDPQFHQVLSII